MARYKIIGVSGARVVEGVHEGAPGESWLVRWGSKRVVSHVVRYYPSKKGWRVIDIRDARTVEIAGGRSSFYVGIRKGDKFYPNEDAAVMVAMALSKSQF